eukprot:364513-Chlamydomonas_euryale.AAC.4
MSLEGRAEHSRAGLGGEHRRVRGSILEGDTHHHASRQSQQGPLKRPGIVAIARNAGIAAALGRGSLLPGRLP